MSRDREPSPLEQALADMIRAIVREEIALALAKASKPAEYLSTAEAAELARVVPDTMRRWIREGRIGVHWAGRELRLKRSDLERLMAGGDGSVATDREIEAMAEETVARRLARRAK